jgi:AcrR family transcriptional regulator
LFADEEELSEEFKTKAAGLFEAVVTARVSAEIEEIEKELAEEAKVAQETFMEEMVQKVDGYLNYVAENWMKENELAIERGLRNEITESFVGSLKEVFAEHYIEVPQEKYDVLGEMQSEIESLKAKLDESTEQKVELSTAKVELEKAAAIKEATADLTVTESEKFGKLVEDVAFDSDYAEKLSVIKENYFPAQKASEEDKLVDDESITESVDGSSPISIYTRAISKSVKR